MVKVQTCNVNVKFDRACPVQFFFFLRCICTWARRCRPWYHERSPGSAADATMIISTAIMMRMLQREDMIELNGMMMTGPGLETNERAFSFIYKDSLIIMQKERKGKKLSTSKARKWLCRVLLPFSALVVNKWPLGSHGATYYSSNHVTLSVGIYCTSILLVAMPTFLSVIVVCFWNYYTQIIIDRENINSIPVTNTQVTLACHVMFFLISKQ